MSFSITIIGTGNIGSHLAKAFTAKGYAVTVWNRNSKRALLLSKELNCSFISDLKTIPSSTDLCILAVSDDVIKQVCALLPANCGIVVHTAGSVDMAVLQSMRKQYGVFYPLQSFIPNRTLQYSHIPVFLEADSQKTLETIQTIIAYAFPVQHVINSEQRKQLHISAVFANNFVNGSIMAAAELLKHSDIEFSVLRPLLAETVLRLASLSPEECQTGPALRNNTSIIDAHLSMLKQYPELEDIYKSMTQYIIQRFHNE